MDNLKTRHITVLKK